MGMERTGLSVALSLKDTNYKEDYAKNRRSLSISGATTRTPSHF